MLQQSSLCEALFSSNLGFRPRFGLPKATTVAVSMDRSASNAHQEKLFASHSFTTSSSSYLTALKQNQQNRNPVLACRALPESRETLTRYFLCLVSAVQGGNSELVL